MSNIELIILYVIPFLISLVSIYYDKDSITVKDFLSVAWWALIPVWNLFIVFFITFMFCTEKTELLLNNFNIKYNFKEKINAFLNAKLKK